MKPADRLAKLQLVRARLAAGDPEWRACEVAGVTTAWYRRWDARPSLKDEPRPGRPPSCEVGAEDARLLAGAYLRSNRGRAGGSMTMAARILAREGRLSPELSAVILASRSSKHSLPAPVRRAMRGAVDPAMVAKYRDPSSGQGPNDGIVVEGFLRMKKSPDGEDARPLRPGERQVWDDGSVNVGIVVPWPWPDDPCAGKFGCRLGRYQLLLGIDCATDLCVGWRLVVHERDAYGAADVVRALHDTWRDNGEIPAEIVVEGGAWQAARTLEFLRLAGVEPVSAKGVPRRKLVEGYFNRLWTALSITLPPKGQIGRFRGEMKKETDEWMRCRAGRLDPRGRFPGVLEFKEAMDRALNHLDSETVESRRFGNFTPLGRYAAAPAACHAYDRKLAPYALPARGVRKVSSQGTVSMRLNPAPHGMAHTYVFACEGLYKFQGRDVTVLFNPWAAGEGALIVAPDGAEMAAICVSPAPDPLSARGYYDPTKPARELKRTNRAEVVRSVAALDARSVLLQGAEPAAVAAVAAPAPLPPPPDPEPAGRETDFAALEAAAGLY